MPEPALLELLVASQPLAAYGELLRLGAETLVLLEVAVALGFGISAAQENEEHTI
jgi:hypothetical protein